MYGCQKLAGGYEKGKRKCLKIEKLLCKINKNMNK